MCFRCHHLLQWKLMEMFLILFCFPTFKTKGARPKFQHSQTAKLANSYWGLGVSGLFSCCELADFSFSVIKRNGVWTGILPHPWKMKFRHCPFQKFGHSEIDLQSHPALEGPLTILTWYMILFTELSILEFQLRIYLVGKGVGAVKTTTMQV